LPSVSERIAGVLVTQYCNISGLQKQLREDSGQLRNLKVTDKRNIGKKTIRVLKEYLL